MDCRRSAASLKATAHRHTCISLHDGSNLPRGHVGPCIVCPLDEESKGEAERAQQTKASVRGGNTVILLELKNEL